VAVRRVGVCIGAVAAALAVAAPAGASFIVGRNASHVTLRIAGRRAIVDYATRGRAAHAVLWGAVNARAPSRSRPQVAFHVRYGGGRLAGGGCRRYDGPALPMLVAACTAPDGSYWALQAWRRLVPNYGGTSGLWELHASHWSGPLPRLQVWQDWSYGRFQHLFGRLTYRGEPVYGFRSTHRGSPLDGYGRNLYLDTRDSRYGPGWRRENGFFCYGFYPHGSHPVGTGSEYRIAVSGPGVTPVVAWHGVPLGPFDRARDRRMNALERSLGDARCRRS
jgi:hypothetical protein